MSFLNAIFKNPQSGAAQEIKTALDLVTHAAGLASNPADIDPLLDEVRKITATLGPEAVLSSTDEATILDVYLGIEAYLATRDPIRTYTKEELRGRLNPDLLSKLTAHEAKGSN